MGDHDDRKPRPGLLPGAWDRLVGPGATRPENAGTGSAAILGAAIGLVGDPLDRAWGPVRGAVAALMGADLFGACGPTGPPPSRSDRAFRPPLSKESRNVPKIARMFKTVADPSIPSLARTLENGRR